MKAKLTDFVNQIVSQTDCTKMERADLYEELLIHLELARDEWMMKGKTIAEAEDLAIKSFGDCGLIGSQIQQAMFPYRKELLLTLSTASILFAISYYLGQLFASFEALIWWLVPVMTTSTILLLLSLNGAIFVNRKKYLNTFLIIHLLLLVLSIDSSGVMGAARLFLTYFNWGIILLNMFIIYQSAISLPEYKGNTLKMAKILHLFNITVGLFFIGISLFFAWGSLWISMISWLTIVSLIPILIWMGLYSAQMIQFRKNKRRTAYWLTAVQLLLFITLFLFILQLFLKGY